MARQSSAETSTARASVAWISIGSLERLASSTSSSMRASDAFTVFMLDILIPHLCRRPLDPQQPPHHIRRAIQSLAIEQLDCGVAGLLHQRVVAEDVADAKSQSARLARAEELAGAAGLEIALGDVEAVARGGEDVQALLLLVRDEDAVRLALAAAHAPAQLVQLREAEAVGVDDDHDRGVGNIDAHLDDRRGHEDVDLVALESLHRLFLFRRGHAAVHHGHAAAGEPLDDGLEALLERLEIQLLRLLDDRKDDVGLRAGGDLAVDEGVDTVELRAGGRRS